MNNGCIVCQTLRQALRQPLKFARLLLRDSVWKIQAAVMRARRKALKGQYRG